MYLQLADNNQPLAQELLEHMVQIPTESGDMVWVREDQLDDVPDDMLWAILQQQPHMSGIRDWFQRIRERRQARKADKQAFKLQKQAGRTDQIKAITGGLTNIFGGGGGDSSGGDRSMFPQVTGGASFGVSQWWQNPMVIGGLAIGALGIVYLVTRKK